MIFTPNYGHGSIILPHSILLSMDYGQRMFRIVTCIKVFCARTLCYSYPHCIVNEDAQSMHNAISVLVVVSDATYNNAWSCSIYPVLDF